MNQKSSLIQTLKSVPRVLTSDTEKGYQLKHLLLTGVLALSACASSDRAQMSQTNASQRFGTDPKLQ
ncbi:hypothetical protein C1J02_12280 [Sulfitobacter sp. SK011]|nr:hypothetical protein C1J02_12280 [Sulfitobacter sp. SK011]